MNEIRIKKIITVKLLQKIGTRSVIQMAKNLGINSHLENNLSIGLGSSGVTRQKKKTTYIAPEATAEKVVAPKEKKAVKKPAAKKTTAKKENK